MHKQTSAHSISASVKKKVALRDEYEGVPCCVICKSVGLPEAHYISRAHGGLGIEENIVTLCRPCHDRFDNGTKEERELLKNAIKDYLKSKYEDWNEEELVYNKWK